MKKLLLILLCLPMIGFGQQTYVPDDNFEAFIEMNYPYADNGIVNDDSVLTVGLNLLGNLQGGTLNIDNIAGPIFDITGIEDFKLCKLNITNTFIDKLDLSNSNFDGNHYGNVNYEINVSYNQYLEEVLLPHNNDSINFTSIYNDSLSEIIFHSDAKYNRIQIEYNFNLCEIFFEGEFIKIGNTLPYIGVERCPNIKQLDFSSITNTPYQTTLSLILNTGTGIASQLEQINLANNIPIYNWIIIGNFDNLVLSPNFPSIQVSNASDSAFCNGNNAWPNVDYGTNCYAPINCQGVTSVIQQQYSENKVLIKKIDLLGRETTKTNQPLFYIYDDGTVEKKIVIE